EPAVALLALAQLLLGAAALGDVARRVDHADRVVLRIAYVRRGDGDVDDAVVRGAPTHRLLERSGAVHDAAGGDLLVRREDGAHVPPYQRALFVSEHLRRGAIGHADSPGEI